MRWNFQPENRRPLYTAAFLYGLLLTNSQIELVLAPAIPFLVMMGNRKIGRDMFLAAGIIFLVQFGGYWPKYFPSIGYYDPGWSVFILLGAVTGLMGIGLVVWTRRAFSEWKAILICSGFFLLGLAFYFYLPITSMTDPPINWSYPCTTEGFFHALARGQYEKATPSDVWPLSELERLLEQVRWYFVTAGKEFGWLYLLLCVIPFCFLRRVAASLCRWILGLLAAYVSVAFLMLAILNPSIDRQTWELNETYFSASYVVLALWLGHGLVLLGVWLTRRRSNHRNSSPHLAAGDAELVHQFQFAPELGAGDFAPQKLAIF